MIICQEYIEGKSDAERDREQFVNNSYLLMRQKLGHDSVRLCFHGFSLMPVNFYYFLFSNVFAYNLNSGYSEMRLLIFL